MNTSRLLVGLTVLNLALLAFSLYQPRAVEAQWGGRGAPVLRGSALEIVDSRGRVRASLTVLPADPNARMPNGTVGHTETVLLRLINSSGRPTVKIAATERGAGFLAGGESDPTYVQVLADGGSAYMKISDQEGQERVFSATK